MNYCTKCSSYYQTPGTCNCFAAARPVIYPQPWYPVPSYPYWPNPTWITVTNNPNGTVYTSPSWSITNNAGAITSGYSQVVT